MAKRDLEVLKTPWDPRDGEDASQYMAFVLYRDMGIGRTLTEVARMLEKMRCPGVTYDTIKVWATDHRWGERCLAWEKHLQDIRANAEIREAKRTAMRLGEERKARLRANLECADSLRMRALEMLNHPIERVIRETRKESPDGRTIIIQQTVEPARWSYKDIAQFLRVASEIEQIAVFDDPDAKVDVDEPTMDASTQRINQFRAEMAKGISSIPAAPPGSIINPIDATPEGHDPEDE